MAAIASPKPAASMASPGDATPSEPCDAQPDDYDVAVVADFLERATTISVRRINHKWAGLRSFVADEAPVAGFDDRVPASSGSAAKAAMASCWRPSWAAPRLT